MRLIYCLLVLLVGSSAAFASHFIGGYIRATPVAGQSLSYQITVTRYYDVAEGAAAAQAADGLYVCFGENGNARLVNRSSIQLLQVGQGVSPGISINEYTTIYTYSGPGVYTIQTTSANRSNTINTSTAPQPFSLRTTFQASTATNHTPVLSLPATGLQLSVNQRVVFSMAATDLEGDSLTYSLAYPLTSVDGGQATGTTLCASAITPTRPYQFPNDVRQTGTYRLSGRTGVLIWDVPVLVGQYSVAIVVSEWRTGSLLSQTQQELTLTVLDRGGNPVVPPAYEPAQLALITALPEADVSGMALMISPNPVAGEALQVTFLVGQAQSVTMELLNSQGRVYNTVYLDQRSREHHYSFDLMGKPAGLYLIRAKSGGQQIVRKVLKQ